MAIKLTKKLIGKEVVAVVDYKGFECKILDISKDFVKIRIGEKEDYITKEDIEIRKVLD